MSEALDKARKEYNEAGYEATGILHDRLIQELEKQNEEYRKSLLNIKDLLNITAPITEQQESVFWGIKNIIRLKGINIKRGVRDGKFKRV